MTTRSSPPPPAHRLGPEHRDGIVRVFCDAFRDYPVMRYVLGERASYDEDLNTLISFFVGCRVLRGDPLFGVPGGDGLLAAATVTVPQLPTPGSVAPLRERTWAALGEEARSRYEAFGSVAASFQIDEPHIHLNMIGAVRAARGKGCARPLLDAVHACSAADAGSRGVTLTTETPENVPLYEHFGYEIVGEAHVGGRFTSWTMYRKDG